MYLIVSGAHGFTSGKELEGKSSEKDGNLIFNRRTVSIIIAIYQYTTFSWGSNNKNTEGSGNSYVTMRQTPMAIAWSET